MEEQSQDEGKGARRALAYSQMGLQLALAVGAGVWAGVWADRRWGSSPWGLLTGLFVGASVGLTLFILEAIQLSRDGDQPKPPGSLS